MMVYKIHALCLYFKYLCIFISNTMSTLAAKLKKGTKVKITTKGQFNGQVGVVRYVGPIQEKKSEGDYVGLELQKPMGKNNGTHNGKEYFKAKQNHGIFLKPTSIALMDGTPVVPPAKVPTANNLSKDLQDAMKTNDKTEQKQQAPQQKVQSVPAKLEKVQKTQKAEKEHENTETPGDNKAQIEQQKKKIKALEQENRVLRMENEKVKYAAKDKDEGKENELKQQIQFYKGQKEAIEKQKVQLKKKNAQLNAELEEYAENMGMVDTLTIKIQTLESKNQKLKQQLQAASSELKNFKMVGESSGKNQAELNENLKILNQTVTLLESDLKQMTDKTIQLESQIKKKETIEADYKKIQRKLKQKEQQVQQMSNELQLMSDTANFVEKLTINMLKKDEQLKEATEKLTEYLGKYEHLQNELAINKEFSDELNQQLFHQEELMDRYSKQIEQKNKHIMELTRQVEKYKKKLFQVTQTNESSSMNASTIMDEKEDPVVSKIFFGGDQYQSKYYNLLKVNNEIRKSELNHLIQFSEIRNQIGVYILNLTEALPESFTEKLQPNVISILTSAKSANDKLYYIFTTVADVFRNKPDIYSKQNSELAQWLIILIKQVITLYSCIHKIQFSLTTAQSEEQISQILEHRVLREQLRRVNDFSLEILQRFVDDNISSSVDLQTFISSIEKFDDININLKRNFNIEYSTKMKLCSEAMETVSNILEAILKYKNTNQLGENAQVDNSLEIFLKTILAYVKECCLNPYIRFKSQMKEYLKGLNLISSILAEIGVQGNYHQLNSLYSETQNIKMLRQTILTTQFHANTLQNDLKDIVYKSQVQKIQTQLPGKFWQERIKQIKQELLRVKQINEDKVELEHQLNESKKKILILERDLKDKQSTKQLYEKRIGQLQLKVEQVASIENQNKRQIEKIKSYEDANKIIEQEIISLTKKNKLIEQENRKIKQKYDTLQTQTMMRNKKQRNVTSMSSEDVANLTIFKNVIKQCNQLRTLQVKKRMLNLKQSPIYLAKQTKKQEQQSISATRAKAFTQISNFTINDPFASKRNPNSANLDSILKEIDRLNSNKTQVLKNETEIVKVGQLIIRDPTIREANISITGLSVVVI